METQSGATWVYHRYYGFPDSMCDNLTRLTMMARTSPPRVRKFKASPMFEKVWCGLLWYHIEGETTKIYAYLSR